MRKRKILTGFIAAITAVTPITSAYASNIIPEEILNTSETTINTNIEDDTLQEVKPSTEKNSKFLFIKLTTGGSVILNKGDLEEKTVKLVVHDKKLFIDVYDSTDVLLSSEEAEKNNFTYMYEVKEDEAITIDAIADENYQINKFKNVKNEIEQQTNFQKNSLSFSYPVFMNEDQNIDVSFSEKKSETEEDIGDEKSETVVEDNEKNDKEEIINKNDEMLLPETIPDNSKEEDKIYEDILSEDISNNNSEDILLEENDIIDTNNGNVVDDNKTAKDIFMEYESQISLLNQEDFTNERLVILTNSPDDIIDKEYIMAQYDNIFLMEYESKEMAMMAYLYYRNKVPAIESDKVIETATDAELSNVDVTMTQNQNPITALNAESNSRLAQSESNVIALIDTGVSPSANVIDRISLIDDSLDSSNTHGDLMVESITSQNKEAKILSIKAIGIDGRGTVSSIVSAMEYAMNQHVDIINLSLCAKTNLVNSVIESEINKATEMGISVVGAAGNDNADVTNYMPGSVIGALIIGAADKDGSKLDGSNFGVTVDYNVVAETTSEAAAKFSGFISKNGLEKVNTELNNGLIYSTSFEPLVDIPNEVTPLPTHAPEYEENSDAFLPDEIWQIEGYPEADSTLMKRKNVWVRDVDYDFFQYNPYGDKVDVTSTQKTEQIIREVGETVEMSYKFSLKETPEYIWYEEITFEFVGDREIATEGSLLVDKLMPEFLTQERNEGYNGIIPKYKGETVQGKTFTVLKDTKDFDLGGLTIDYNPKTFKVNHIQENGFDISIPGTYKVIHEVSHFMFYDYSWFVENTVNVIDPATLAPGYYLTSAESTLMFNRDSDNLYGGYGDLVELSASNADFSLSCYDDEFNVAAMSSNSIINPDDICSITDYIDGKKHLSIAVPSELPSEAVIISIYRPGYDKAKLFTGGGWKSDAFESASMNNISEKDFEIYESELSGQSNTDSYMNVAADWTTVKSTTIPAKVVTGGKTNTNYGWISDFPGSNTGEVQVTEVSSKIVTWAKNNGFDVAASKLKNFDVSCNSTSELMSMKTYTTYNINLQCQIQKSGTNNRLRLVANFTPASDSQGNYQNFYGAYSVSVENNGALRIYKMFRNSSIAEKTDRVGTLKTVFGIYTNRACTDRYLEATIPLKNETEGGYKASGEVDLTPGTYWVKELYRIAGCASNTDIYGPVPIKAGQTVNIGRYFESNGLDSQWENMEKGWVYNRPYYYRGRLLMKHDSTTMQPVSGAVYKIQYSEFEDDSSGHSFRARYTWYFKTDADGFINYDDAHLLTSWNGHSSSELIRRRDDAPALPIGFLRIQEVEAPKGYKLDSTIYKRKIKNITVDGYEANVPIVDVKEDRVEEDWSIQVNAKKVDRYLDGLSGAVFRVYDNPSCSGSALGTLSSDYTGMTNTLVIDRIPNTTSIYTVYAKEIQAPSGYSPTNEIFSLTFTKSRYEQLKAASSNPDSFKGELQTFGPTNGIVNDKIVTPPGPTGYPTPTPTKKPTPTPTGKPTPGPTNTPTPTSTPKPSPTPAPTNTPTPTPLPPVFDDGELSVEKTSSANSEIIDLSGYSLAGAEFSVTSDRDGYIGTLVTDENGLSNTIALPDNSEKIWHDDIKDPDGNVLIEGYWEPIKVTTVYTVKEIKAPDGHKLNFAPYTFSVTMPDDAGKTVKAKFEDEPYFCDNQLEIEKLGVKGNKIKGVVFKVEFFDALSADSSKLKKTWYLESDTNGKVYMDNMHISKRPEFASDSFYTHEGKIVIPIDGYLQFTEVAAPAEYVVNDEPFGMITGKNVNLSKRVYNDMELCEIKLKKYQDDGVTPIPGVEFEIKFLEATIKPTADKNQYFGRLLEEGESYISSTDKNGELTFKGLDHGKYQITEVRTHSGNTLLKEPIIVTVPMTMTQDEANNYGNVDFDTAKEDKGYTDKWFFYSCLFEITNHAKFVVPMTGGSGVWKIGFIGMGVLALTGTILIINDTKNDTKTNKKKRKK